MFTNISGVFLCWAEEAVLVWCSAVLLSAGHCRPPEPWPCNIKGLIMPTDDNEVICV